MQSINNDSDKATKRRSDAGELRRARSDSFDSPRLSFPSVAPSLRRSVASARGFTLVEIMVVVVIVGLLAGLSTYAVVSYLDKAKVKTARADMSTLAGAVN